MRNSIIENDLNQIINFDLPWFELANKTVFISGAAGMLPAYMVETLLYLNEKKGLNIKVIGLVRNKDKALKRFTHYQDRADLKYLMQDVCAPIILNEKIDYIIHAASQASPKFYGKDPVGTLLPNVVGTYNLLELSRENHIKCFLFISSAEVYGQTNELKISIKENTYGHLDPTDVRSCYAESKRLGETMCISWLHQYGVPTKIVRPFHVYGPGMSLDDGRVFADFVANVLGNQNIFMKSDGRARRSFCYVVDAIQGFFTVLFKGNVGTPYNIGNPNCEVSILDLANILASLFLENKLKVIKKELSEDTPGYIKSRISRIIPDISAVQHLGWFPTTSIEDGFTRTIESF